MDGINRRGRPRRRWTDDVEEWCNNYLHTLSMKAADRTEWRHMWSTQTGLEPNDLDDANDNDDMSAENYQDRESSVDVIAKIIQCNFWLT